MPQAATFNVDFKRGKGGEFASIVPMAYHLKNLRRVEVNCTEDRSYDLGLFSGTRQAKCDVKTDWKTVRTGNLFFEPISQVRRDDDFINKDLLWDMFCGNPAAKHTAVKSILDDVMGRLIAGKSVLSTNRVGWSVKNLSHTVSYWSILASQNCFNNKPIMDKYFGNSTLFYKYMLRDLAKVHDEFMHDVGVSRYLFYIFKKSVLFDYMKDNYHTLRAVIVPNRDYLTLGYLLPITNIDELRKTHKTIQFYAWRV